MFAGTMIAPGIAFGPALVWTPAVEPVPSERISTAAVAPECQRLEHAVRRVRRELDEIALRVALSVGESTAAVFRAHGAMLDDPAFLAVMRLRIVEEHLAAQSAVFATVEEYAGKIAAAGNSYLSARAEDIRDLGNRVLTHLRKEGPHCGPRLESDGVLVAENLAAADVVSLDRQHLLALVMVQGGATSHAAILASTLGVPVVGAVPQLTGHVRNGDTIIVDGNHGHIIVRPTPLAGRQRPHQSRLAQALKLVIGSPE